MTRWIIATIVGLWIVCTVSATAAGSYGGGSGTAEDPYQIWTAEQMNTIGLNPDDWNKHFVLMADIDLSDYDGRDGRGSFNIIADVLTWDVCQETPFIGVFDGADHVVSHFTYASGIKDYVSMFGYIGPGGQVTNLEMSDVSVVGRKRTGALVGYNMGSISNCRITGDVTGQSDVGGLAGANTEGQLTHCGFAGRVVGHYKVGGLVGISAGTILQCHASGEVSGDSVGGIVGSNQDGTVIQCHFKGDIVGDYAGGLAGGNSGVICDSSCVVSVTGQSDSGGLVGSNVGLVTRCYSTGSVDGGAGVGGLVGSSWARGQIVDCYAHVETRGIDMVGGLVGHNDGAPWHGYWAIIENCYSTGYISAVGTRAGPIVGRNDGFVRTCFWNAQTVGIPANGAGEPITPAQMRMRRSFEDVGWDFVGVWEIGEHQTFPVLRQSIAADFDADGSVALTDLAIMAGSWLVQVSPAL